MQVWLSGGWGAERDADWPACLSHPPPPRHQVIGDDVSPGIKAGGRINWIRRTIPCLARGDSIPRDFTVDIRCGKGVDGDGGVCLQGVCSMWRASSDAPPWLPCAPPPNRPAPPCALPPHPPWRSKMGLNDKLHFTDLRVPPGCALHRVNQQLPILKVAK